MKLNEYFRSLFIIYFALIGGLLFFMTVIVFLSITVSIDASMAEMKNLFAIIVAVMVLAAVYAGNFIYQAQMNSLKNISDYKQKFIKVRSLLIIQWAILEGPAFLVIVFYMLTGSWYFLVFFVLIILLFLRHKPKKEKVLSDMNLTDELKEQMKDPDFILTNE